MKRILFFACTLTLLFMAPFAKAAHLEIGAAPDPAPKGGPFAAGIILGEPTGLSGKVLVEHPQIHAVQGALAYSFQGFALFSADALMHLRILSSGSEWMERLSPYVGAGLLVVLATDSAKKSAVGLRVPLGAEWMAPKAPIGVFLEIVPGVGLIPNTFGYFNGALGVRYYLP